MGGTEPGLGVLGVGTQGAHEVQGEAQWSWCLFRGWLGTRISEALLSGDQEVWLAGSKHLFFLLPSANPPDSLGANGEAQG